MSFNTGFAGYSCHPTQLSTQLSLMTSNSNNSSAESQCCSSSGGTDSRTNTANNVTNNTDINLSANEENHTQSAVPSTQSLSSPSPVCALTTPYDSRIISGYPRLGGFYGPSYPEQNSFYTSGGNPFYSSFGNPYDLKDPNPNGWTPFPQTSCYPYDAPIFSPYGERYCGIDGATRRKNVTRDSTTTLKAWLNEHRKNPYPTKGEKIMLAIITKMTLTQVSTWFANARRRLKKENKMTWEPRNRSDGYDSDDKDSFGDTDDNSSNMGDNTCLNGTNKLYLKKESDSLTEKTSTDLKLQTNTVKGSIGEKSHSEHIPNGLESKNSVANQLPNISRNHLIANNFQLKHDSTQNMLETVPNIETIGQRPKIWSLAQMATSETNPYNSRIGPVTTKDWLPALPPGPDGAIALLDYQRDCPQGSRFAATNLPKYGQSWPEDHCITNLSGARSAAMHLFTTDTIGSHNYLNSHPSKTVSVSSFSVYGTDYRISSDTQSDANNSFSAAISGGAVHLQTQDNNSHNNNK